MEDGSTNGDPNQPSEDTLRDLDEKYAAYARRDVYGTMGLGPFPVKEKILLGVAMLTLLPIRLVLGMGILITYYLICRVCTLLKAPNKDEDEQEDYAHMGGWRRAVIVGCGRFLSRALLFVLGFYWISESCRDFGTEEKLEHNQVRHQFEEFHNFLLLLKLSALFDLQVVNAKGFNTSFLLWLDGQSEERGSSEEKGRPGVVVSNHVSYLDILYHMSSSFPSFVAKVIIR